MTPTAAHRQSDGRRLLRVRFGGNLRHLRGRAGHGRHRVRRLHAGHAGHHGDPRLPGRPVPGRAAAAPGHGRGRATCRTSRVRSAGQGRGRPRHRRAVTPRRQPREQHDRDVEQELELSMEKLRAPRLGAGPQPGPRQGQKEPIFSARSSCTRCSSTPGSSCSSAASSSACISGLQGEKVVADDDNFFVPAFQGVLCLFLLEMGMTASRKLKDLQIGRTGFHLLRVAGAEPLCDAGDHRRAHLRATDPHRISSPAPTCCSRCSAARRRTSPSRRFSGWPSPRRARRCRWPHRWV